MSIDWKTLWENPVGIFNAISSNERALIYLRDIHNRLEEEIRLAKTTKNKGYLVEGERKQKLLVEIRNIDPAFENEIVPLNNSEDILKRIKARTSSLDGEIRKAKGEIKELSAHEKVTTKKMSELVARYLVILGEMAEIYAYELRNINSNRKYEIELIKALSSGEFEGRINEFQREAQLAFQRANENKLLQEQIISYVDIIITLKHEADNSKKEFETETNGISAAFNKIIEFLKGGKRLNKNEMEKEAGGLVPKWTG